MQTSLPSPDGNWSVIYDSEMHSLTLADLQAGTRELLRFPCPPPCCICWAPGSQLLAVALPGVGPKLFLATIGSTLLPCPDPGKSPILSMAFSSDMTSLAIGRADGEIRLLSQERHWTWISGIHPSAVTVLSWSPDGRYLASASLSGLLILHDTSGHTFQMEQCPLLVTELEWISDRELHVIHQQNLIQIIEPGNPLP